jgi:hypothetical protein
MRYLLITVCVFFLLAGCATVDSLDRAERHGLRLDRIDVLIDEAEARGDEGVLRALQVDRQITAGSLIEAEARVADERESSFGGYLGLIGSLLEGLAPLAGIFLPGVAGAITTLTGAIRRSL